MGRKKIIVHIGEIYGCYKILSLPVAEGHHSFVNVECIYCHNKYYLCTSDIVNRPKQHCKHCRGEGFIKYETPEIGTIFNYLKVVDNNIVYVNRFRCVLCECIYCGTQQPVRLERLYNIHKGRIVKCRGCKRHSDIIKSEKQEALTQRKQRQPFITKLHRIMTGAGTRSIPVYLTSDDLETLWSLQEGKCAITGDSIDSVYNASLDRIDSSKPYEIGNVQWVTKQANLCKHKLTMEQLYDFCEKVLNHADQQPSQPLTKLEGSETKD